MRVTIIPSDGFVSVNGKGINELDLKFIDASVHAIQWFDTDGEIERRDERGRILSNEFIDDLTPYQAAIDAWQVEADKVEPEGQSNGS